VQPPTPSPINRVALDARWFGGRGIGRYTETLYLGLNQIVPANIFPLTSGTALPGGARLRLPGYVLKEQLEIPLRFAGNGFDLVHFTGGTAPLLKPRPSVVTVHDVMFFRPWLPSSPSARQLFGKAYRRFAFVTGTLRADHLVVVSEDVREQLATLFSEGLPPLTVIREAPHPKFSRAMASQERAAALSLHGVEERMFFLHLGGTDPRKNTRVVLGAFADYCRGGGHCDLVITGLSPRMISMLKREIPSELRRRLHLANFRPDSELISLMQTCMALVFVSSDEGFGLPVVEGMAAGAAVIASDIAAVREAAGGSALFVPPRNYVALREAMLLAESDQALLQRLRREGLKKTQPADFLRMASETLNVYRLVLDSQTG
jgi:glycosyltransferase involved in cell wall biosynthesis